MDEYGVPKKINRHVLKALHYQKDIGCVNASVAEICDLVKFSMRNLVPVRDLSGTIRHSLQNMCHLGVIGKSGTKFFVRPYKLNPEINLKLFGIKNRRKMKNGSDKNLKRSNSKCDTLTRGAITKTRRPSHSVKKLRRRQRSEAMPKTRKFGNNYNLSVGYEQDGNDNKEFLNNHEEDGRGNNYFLNCSLKKDSTSDTEMDQSPPQNDQNQKSNETQTAEENQNNNTKDRPLVPKTGPSKKENMAAESKVDKTAAETNAKSPKGS